MNNSPLSLQAGPSRQAAAAELLRRRQARKGLQSFISYVKDDYIVSHFSQTVCVALDKFLDDLAAGLRPILILRAPPQHGKSDIVSRSLPAYMFGRMPDLNIGGLSYSKDLASEMNRDVQRIMMSDEYNALFPETALNRKRVVAGDVEPKRNSETFEIVGRKGRYICAGVGGPLTGKKLDVGLIDDPIKNAQEALSPTVKESIWNWYQTTFLTRLSKNSGQIIMATSWAMDDLSGRIIKNNPRAIVLDFPAINDLNEEGYNPDLPLGALVPELHPIEKLQETKRLLSAYFWAAMYQQKPKPLGGTIFKDFGVRHYSRYELPTEYDELILSWDMTFKDTSASDYVVGQAWMRKGANAYLLAQTRERMTFTQSLSAVKSMRERFPDALSVLIEDKANGPAIMDVLRDQVPGLTPVEPDGSKEARAHAVTSFWEAGNVWLPLPEDEPWVEDYITEMTTFPAAPNDDQVDTTTQALRHLFVKSGWSFFS